MKPRIACLKFVQWSEADGVFIGYCPDLFIGGVCHGKNEARVYAELSHPVEDDLKARRRAGKSIPPRQSIVAA